MQNQTRIIIENVTPQLDGGAFYIKRILGQSIEVRANVFADGHDVVACSVKYKHQSEKKWQEIRMAETSNDEWVAQFQVEKQGFYSYFVEGWVDYALNWQHGTKRKIQDNQYVKSELLEGAEYCQAILKEANPTEKKYLTNAIKAFQEEALYEEGVAITLSSDLYHIFQKYPTRTLANTSHELKAFVDRKRHYSVLGMSFFHGQLLKCLVNTARLKIVKSYCRALPPWGLIPYIFHRFIL